MSLPRLAYLTERRIHIILTFVWIGLLVPTLLLWKESILWIAFMSLYANIAGHWSAAEAAKAGEKIDEASPHQSEQ